MQEVTGSSPVSPTTHPFHAQTDRITASRRPGGTARLQASAGGGEILMCAATFEAVADAYPGRRTPTPSAQGRGVHGPEFPDPYRVTRGLT